MSETIPEEVMREATQIFADADLVETVPEAVEIIARALLARDERAEKIAEMRSEYGHNHGELIYLDGPAIASAIRDRSKT